MPLWCNKLCDNSKELISASSVLVEELGLQRSSTEIEAIAVFFSLKSFAVSLVLAAKDTGCKARMVYVSFHRQLKE